MARPRGVEPLTPGSEVQCSIQLSYGRGPFILFENSQIFPYDLNRKSQTSIKVIFALNFHFLQVFICWLLRIFKTLQIKPQLKLILSEKFSFDNFLLDKTDFLCYSAYNNKDFYKD